MTQAGRQGADGGLSVLGLGEEIWYDKYLHTGAEIWFGWTSTLPLKKQQGRRPVVVITPRHIISLACVSRYGHYQNQGYNTEVGPKLPVRWKELYYQSSQIPWLDEKTLNLLNVSTPKPYKLFNFDWIKRWVYDLNGYHYFNCCLKIYHPQTNLNCCIIPICSSPTSYLKFATSDKIWKWKTWSLTMMIGLKIFQRT